MTTQAADAGVAGAVRAPLPPHTVLDYRLEEKDALAWERRDPVERKRKRALYAASLLAGLMLLSVTSQHLPSWLTDLHSNVLAVAILLLPLGVAALIQARDLSRRAREAVPEAVNVRLEVWDRRLKETRDGRKQALVVGTEELRDVVETGEHVFLYARVGTIIVPASAFGDAAAKESFAEHWRAVVK
ncbi:hypothetical protein HYN69_14140 [Gemmobacter aquarius]|uniref:YcxB-like protein n=1 Tax=Paragemmobacter aquarius TaxID=2169400 RepID=A0A2S0UNU1_9RHOB|nr:hypothetical protein [Gemmobacter aquarius]AWB49486.1 hypothetical protein HYN69_14140 [Gemmobacter aquarius]